MQLWVNGQTIATLDLLLRAAVSPTGAANAR